MIKQILEKEKPIRSTNGKDLAFYLNQYDKMKVRCQVNFGKNNDM